MGIFEALMLLSFGVSWPFAIAKTIKAKNPAGKSLLFAWLITFGYVCGIVNKILNPGKADWVIWFYIADLLLVLTDTAFVYYYMWRNKR